MSETRFEDAGYNFFEGNLDPSALVSYFPDLRGSLLSSVLEVDMFAGVADCMPPYDSVDDISASLSQCCLFNAVSHAPPSVCPNSPTTLYMFPVDTPVSLLANTGILRHAPPSLD